MDPSFRSTSRQSALHTPSLKTKTPLDLLTVLSGKHYALLLPDGTKDGLHIVHEVRSVCKDGDPSNLGFLGVYGNSQVDPVVKINLMSSKLVMLGTAAVEEHNGCVTVVVDKITSVCPSPICLVDGTSDAEQTLHQTYKTIFANTDHGVTMMENRSLRLKMTCLQSHLPTVLFLWWREHV